MPVYKNLAEFFKLTTSAYSRRNAIYWKDSSSKSNEYESISGNKLKELVYLL